MSRAPLQAPALLPAAAALAGVALARALALPPPVGVAALLVPLGAALGGGLGTRAVVPFALGLLAALTGGSGPRLADFVPGAPVAATGTICSHPQRFLEGSTSVTLCAELVRRGARVAPGEVRLRLDLPPGLAPPPLGARVHARGTLRRSAGHDNADRSPPGRWSLRVKAAPFLEVRGTPPPPLVWVAELRRRLDRAWAPGPAASFDPATSLARALVLGDAQALPRPWQAALRRTGLAHLIAVSGFNVALVAGAALLASAALPRPLALANGVAAASGYLALVGPEPSLVRATAMAGAAAAALLLRRAPTPLHALAWVAGGMALLEPGVVDRIGFRLSVAATGGLLALAPRLLAAFPERPRALSQALAVSLGAQIGATPFAVEAFGRLPLAAPLLNLALVPAAAVGLVAGLLAGAFEVAGLPAGARLLRPALALAALPFEALARLPPSPLWSLAVPANLVAGLALAAALWGAIACRRFREGLLFVLLLVGWSAHGSPGASELELAMLDVGQGEALLLRGGGASLLIDGGGARGRDLAALVLAPALERRGVRRLDAVVLSHGDLDHCGGLLDLVGWIAIDAIWQPEGLAPNPCVEQLARAAPVTRLRAGDQLEIGGFAIEALHPPAGRVGAGNSVSLVLAARAGGRRLLLTGDLDGAGERQIVARLDRRDRYDLLKVAHHGSGSSTQSELLDRIRPRLALISAGPGNAYGHPSAATLERLAARGIPTLRTQRDGEISIRWRAGSPLRIALPGSPRRHLERPVSLD